MRKVTLAVLLLTILFSSAYSQDNYVSGIIINNLDETISGYINYKPWDINPDKIEFKKSLQEEPIVYTVNDLKSFKLEDRYFKSKKVLAEISSMDLEKLTYEPEFNNKEYHVFMEVLVEGEANLYKFYDSKLKVHFYIEKDIGNVEELALKLYKKEIESSVPTVEAKTTSIQRIERYKTLLKFYFSDMPNIDKTINTLRYSEKSFMKLFERYNKQEAINNLKYLKSKEKSLNYIVHAGTHISHISFASDITTFKYLEEIDFPLSVSYNLGFTLNAKILRGKRKLSVYSDLGFCKSSYAANYTGYARGLDGEHEINLDYSYFRFNGGFKYDLYDKNNFTINANIGFIVNYLYNFKNELIRTGSWTSDTVEAVPLDHNLTFGNYVIGVGCLYKKYGLDYKFLSFRGVVSHDDVQGRVFGHTISLFYVIN